MQSRQIIVTNDRKTDKIIYRKIHDERNRKVEKFRFETDLIN